MNDIKKRILASKDIEELEEIESEEYQKFRDNFYNKLLEDNDIKKHIAKLFNISLEESPNLIQNMLMINGCPPPDDFEEN